MLPAAEGETDSLLTTSVTIVVGSGLNLDSFVSFSQKPELRWFRVARLAVCSISSLAQIERLRLRRRRHRL